MPDETIYFTSEAVTVVTNYVFQSSISYQKKSEAYEVSIQACNAERAQAQSIGNPPKALRELEKVKLCRCMYVHVRVCLCVCMYTCVRAPYLELKYFYTKSVEIARLV